MLLADIPTLSGSTTAEMTRILLILLENAVRVSETPYPAIVPALGKLRLSVHFCETVPCRYFVVVARLFALPEITSINGLQDSRHIRCSYFLSRVYDVILSFV
jgi:hypothetical protein